MKYKKVLSIAILVIVLGLCSCTKKTDLTTNTTQTTTNKYQSVSAIYNYDQLNYGPDGGCKINDYYGELTETITIPSELLDLPVTHIGERAYSNMTGVKQIIIPSTVEYIADNAFCNNRDLESIVISDDSQLKQIGNFCFRNNVKLGSFKITSKLEYVGEGFLSGSNVNNIEIQNNRYFDFESGLLIQNVNNFTLSLAIYAAKNVSNVVVPDKVSSLETALFMDNKTIKSIDLANVKYISFDCFKNSSIETIIGGDLLEDIGSDAFLNTPWINNNTQRFVTLKNILYKVNDTTSSTIIIDEGITDIGAHCFSNVCAETIILPSTVNDVGVDAFIGNNNLKTVILQRDSYIFFGNDCFPKDVTIYVPKSNYSRYQNDVTVRSWFNQIQIKTITITFKDENGEILGTRENEYYGTLTNYIQPSSLVDGKWFYGWIDENGVEYSKNGIVYSYEDIVLTPVYR